MPIICFEGASAAGKTTLSNYLREKHDSFAIVPEVNFLFERKADEPKYWYFEKQAERWQIAVNESKNHETIVLDGDPFQPLWYNWSYDFNFGEPLVEIADFYRKALASGAIDFPEKYFILTVEIERLKERKINDAARTRKNFQHHLAFIQPQKAYFNFIKSVENNLVEFIENEEIEKTAEKILNSVGKVDDSKRISPFRLFSEIESWLKTNEPEKFIF